MITDLITATSNKFLNSKVIFSCLLTRKDESQQRIQQINSAISKKISTLPVHVINHSNICIQYLRDKKHLNMSGARVFAGNFIAAVHGNGRSTRLTQSAGKSRQRYQDPTRNSNTN